jgi:hypothetical protein
VQVVSACCLCCMSDLPSQQCMFVCVRVCEREREGEGERWCVRERERERVRERERE